MLLRIKEISGLFELGHHLVNFIVRITTCYAFPHLLPTIAARLPFFVQKRTLRCTGSLKLTILYKYQPHGH